MDPVRIFVGTEPSQYIAQQVLGDTIRKHTSSPVEIRYTRQELPRQGGTKFGFVRFMIPSLCGFQGKAIYMDADIVVYADIRELWDQLSDEKALGLVHDPVGIWGDKPVKKGIHSSVMVMNCERLADWKPEALFKNVVSGKKELQDGQVRYSDFMSMKWVDPAIIQPIDTCWNHYNIVREDTKAIHFSHVRTQPWKSPKHELTPTWEKELLDAIRRGAVKRSEVLREVLKLHIHPHFLKFAFAK